MSLRLDWQRAVFFCLCLLCITPLLFYPYNLSAYQSPKVLYLSLILWLALLFWAFDCLLGQGGRPRWDPSSWLLFLFILWTVVRYPWFAGGHFYLRNPTIWVNLGLTYFLVRQYAGEEGKARPLIFLWAGVGVAVCLYGLLQFGGIDLALYRSKQSVFASIRPEGLWGRPFSTLGNPNFLGEFVAGILPLLVGLYLGSRRSIYTFLWGASAVVSAVLIVLSGARGAGVGAAAGLVLLFFWERGKGRLHKALLLLLATSVVISGALLIGGTRSGFTRTWQKVAMITSPGQGSVGARLLWWRVSWEMIRSHPFLGVGTGAFREAYPLFQERFLQEPGRSSWIPRVALAWKDNYNATLEAPHNEFLQMTAELGLVGTSLFFAFCVLLLIPPARAPARARSWWKNACAAGCIAILIASLFGFPLHQPACGLLFFFMAALPKPLPGAEARGTLCCGVKGGNTPLPRAGSDALPPETGAPTKSSTLWGGFLGNGSSPPRTATGETRNGDPVFGTVLVLLACLALLQAIHQGKVFQSGRYLYRAVGHQLSGRSDQAFLSLSDAKRLNPKDREVDYLLGMGELSRGRPNSARGYLEGAKSSFSSPALYLILGMIYADLQEPESAEAALRKGISIYPGLAPLPARLGALYARQGRYEEALRSLHQAKQIDPSYAETYHFLGHLLHRLRREEEAAQALEQFLQLAPPKDPRRPQDLALLKRLALPPKSP